MSDLVWCAGAQELVEAVEQGYAHVRLEYGVNPSEEEVVEIARVVGQSTSLTHLELCDNKIADVGASALANAIKKNTSLVYLNLGRNKITDVGALALAEAITKSTSLKYVDLGCNRITDVSASTLADAIKKSTSLTHLYLIGGNNITKVGHDAIRVAFKVSKVARPTLWLLRSQHAAVQKFFKRDGDHAIWFGLVEFLV